MNPLIQLKKATPLTLAVFVLVCLTLLPTMQAVVPAPDGDYGRANTAEGSGALFSLTPAAATTRPLVAARWARGLSPAASR
jgi:hypothetical protein